MQWGEGVVVGGFPRLVVEDAKMGWIFVSNIRHAQANDQLCKWYSWYGLGFLQGH